MVLNSNGRWVFMRTPAANFVELVKEVNKFMRAMCYHEDEILAIDYLGVEWQATPMKESNDA
jgi:hypothetical protein